MTQLQFATAASVQVIHEKNFDDVECEQYVNAWRQAEPKAVKRW